VGSGFPFAFALAFPLAFADAFGLVFASSLRFSAARPHIRMNYWTKT
jgi:hypothetical protein